MRTISLVDTAKLVRATLKRHYPSITFTVRTSRYSMGQSIDVAWTDGPPSAEVNAILKPFCGQRFEGIDDSTHRVDGMLDGEPVHFEAHYVTGQRTHSAAFLRQVAAKVARQYGLPCPVIAENRYGEPEMAGGWDIVPDAPPFNQPEPLRDVIYYVMHRTSAMPKPRIRVMAEARIVA